MKIHMKERPDRGWSWVIVFATFMISLVLAGIYRTSGFLLVAFVHEFRVSREDASWPLVLCFTIVDLTGIVVGPLGQRFGLRPITIAGSLISAVGVSLCYFANSLKFITICFGIIFGCGFGLAYTLMPVIINEYFLNYRATANGISHSGACFGSVLFPPLYEYLMTTYNFNGCLLLLAGIILQLVVAGSLMKPASWLQTDKTAYASVRDDDKTVVFAKLSQKNTCNYFKEAGINETMTYKYSSDKIQDMVQRKRSFTFPCSGLNNYSKEHKLCKKTENKSANALDSYNSNKVSINKQEDKHIVSFLQENVTKNEKIAACSSSAIILTGDGVDCRQDKLNELVTADRRSNGRETNNKKNRTILDSFKIVLSNPMFYIIGYTTTLFYFIEELFFVINVDFYLDKNVQVTDTKYIVFAFSFCDLFGRLCLGWVTDRKFLRRSHFVIICMAIIAVVFFLFPFADNYIIIMILNCIYGMLLGCTTIVLNVLLVDYLEMDVQAVAFGFLAFLNGLLGMACSTLIGYFRDYLGSYSNIFFIIGAMSLATSLILLLEKYLVKPSSGSENVNN